MTTPKVSVVMCAYNAEAYLEAAIDSILQQTFTDFEFIIVDDGSTDRTADILADYAVRDSRITVLTNKSNLSVPSSTNRGFAKASGQYIARMDADDIAAPTRFEEQVHHLDSNADCVVVGTGYQQINARGDIQKTDRHSMTATLIKWRALFRIPFLHSSTMFRRKSITANEIEFDPAFDGAADFDFLQRLLRTGNAALIPIPLMQYRMHASNVSTRKRRMQQDAGCRASIRETERAYPEIPQEKVRYLFHYLHADAPATFGETMAACASMRALQTAFCRRHNLPNKEMRQQNTLATRWLTMTILRRQPLLGRQSALLHLLALRQRLSGLITETIRYVMSRQNILDVSSTLQRRTKRHAP